MRSAPLTPVERQFCRNLAQTVARLHDGQIEEGRRWWPNARADIDRTMAIAPDVPAHLGCMAAATLSAGVRWPACVETLDLVVQAFVEGAESYPRGVGAMTFGYRGRDRAWAILHGDETMCRGRKVQAVFANLMGDLYPIAVDRHVVRAATGRFDVAQLAPSLMRIIEDDLRLLAIIKGIRPAELQAAIWVAATRP